MNKRERIAALEMRSTNLESDIRILRGALESYAETIKGLVGKIALRPPITPAEQWTGGDARLHYDNRNQHEANKT